MSLLDLTRNAVQSFLSTVLLVDEEWTDEVTEKAGTLETPGLKPHSGDQPEIAAESVALVAVYESPLDIGAVVRAFSVQGLHAAPVKPVRGTAGEFVKALDRVAARSDVVVLDWNLYGDSGERALALAKRLVQADNGHRARMLVFYSGQPVDEIESRLKTELDLPDFEAGRSRSGPLSVAVLVKEDSKNALPEDPRRVSVDDLPERIVEILSDEFAGILPTVALLGLAHVRDNTHRVLARFPGTLDPGYLGHRSLLVDPEDAADQLHELLADEVRAVLRAPAVSSAARLPTVLAWINNPSPRFGAILDAEQLTKIHQLGYPEDDNPRWAQQRPPNAFLKTLKAAPSRVHAPTLVPDDADRRWSLLMSGITDYDFEPPRLQLGAIICQRGESDQFFLCVMPLCDSVRLESPTKFPLVPLTLVEAPKRFNCVIRDYDGRWKELVVPTTIANAQFHEFVPTSGAVRASKTTDTSWEFRSTGPIAFDSIGSLKPTVAQRFVQSIATNMARIALDESDWLRRMSKS